RPDRAADVLGDPATVDPCALLAGAEPDGAEPAPPESFDYCVYEVSRADGAVVLRVGELTAVDAPTILASGGEEVPGVGRHLRVFRHAGEGDDLCTRTVYFADEVGLGVSGDTYDTPDTTVPGLCDVVDEATAAVVARLESGRPVPRAELPAGSIGTLDACAALGDAAIASVLGTGNPAVTEYPAGHQCRWGDEAVPSLSVRYVRGEVSTEDVVRQEIAGRTTTFYRTEITDRALCLAETPPGVAGELAQIVVRLPRGQLDLACQAAGRLAADAWPKLPS
ncbi:MAG TPA: hypothetical protein VGD43_11790, partial [Micromonospora sp.]